MIHKALTDKIIGGGIEVHKHLGPRLRASAPPRFNLILSDKP